MRVRHLQLALKIKAAKKKGKTKNHCYTFRTVNPSCSLCSLPNVLDISKFIISEREKENKQKQRLFPRWCCMNT